MLGIQRNMDMDKHVESTLIDRNGSIRNLNSLIQMQRKR